jgi:GntR family transcriptional regulator
MTKRVPSLEASVETPGGRRRRIDDAARMRDLLRGKIMSGRYGESQLPSESELILEYAVGRNVTRDALDLLRAEGLVERIQGSGTFVLADKAAHRFDRFHGINDSVSRSRSVRGRVLTTSTIIACRPVADQLRLERGSPCVT